MWGKNGRENEPPSLSLLSDCVARFALEADKAQRVDCLVRARSLYVMKGAAR